MTDTANTKTVWLVLDPQGNPVHYSSADGQDQGYEIHKTRKIAKSFAFNNETVKKATITWE